MVHLTNIFDMFKLSYSYVDFVIHEFSKANSELISFTVKQKVLNPVNKKLTGFKMGQQKIDWFYNGSTKNWPVLKQVSD